MDDDKRIRLNKDTHQELLQYKNRFGISLKTLIIKAIKYGLENSRKVWGVKP
ncbi:MAG: hypothetical protein ACERKJ_10635 [Candidatus Dadabacteria bacterium]